MKHTISVLVENHSGVLSRISGLFSRRGFNIESLAVGPTHDPAVSRITIVADGDEHTVEQIEKQLNKLIEVIKVKTFGRDEYLARELMIVKVSATANKRSEIMTIADVTGAKVGGKACSGSAIAGPHPCPGAKAAIHCPATRGNTHGRAISEAVVRLTLMTELNRPTAAL